MSMGGAIHLSFHALKDELTYEGLQEYYWTNLQRIKEISRLCG